MNRAEVIAWLSEDGLEVGALRRANPATLRKLAIAKARKLRLQQLKKRRLRLTHAKPGQHGARPVRGHAPEDFPSAAEHAVAEALTFSTQEHDGAAGTTNPSSAGSVDVDELIDDELIDKALKVDQELLGGFAPDSARAIQQGKNQTRFGNQVSLLGTDPSQSRRLLEAQDLAAGSWVLSVRTEVLASAVTDLNLAMLQVTMGTGGATEQLIVNASPNATIYLPCQNVSVDAFWDTLPATGGVVALTLPNVRVSAMLWRAQSIGYAHRFFIMPFGAVIFNAAQTFPVPAFAKRFWAWSGGAGGAGFWNINTVLTFLTANGRTVMQFTGADLFIKAARGESLDVPGGSDNFTVQSFDPAFSSAVINMIDFEVRL